MNDRAMQEVEQEMAPILAAFADEIIQNAKLFARVRAVHAARDTSGLAPDQRRLLEVVHRNFARRGAALDAQGPARRDQPAAFSTGRPRGSCTTRSSASATRSRPTRRSVPSAAATSTATR
jgi:hypothetical protein